MDRSLRALLAAITFQCEPYIIVEDRMPTGFSHCDCFDGPIWKQEHRATTSAALLLFGCLIRVGEIPARYKDASQEVLRDWIRLNHGLARGDRFHAESAAAMMMTSVLTKWCEKAEEIAVIAAAWDQRPTGEEIRSREIGSRCCPTGPKICNITIIIN